MCAKVNPKVSSYRIVSEVTSSVTIFHWWPKIMIEVKPTTGGAPQSKVFSNAENVFDEIIKKIMINLQDILLSYK